MKPSWHSSTSNDFGDAGAAPGKELGSGCPRSAAQERLHLRSGQQGQIGARLHRGRAPRGRASVPRTLSRARLSPPPEPPATSHPITDGAVTLLPLVERGAVPAGLLRLTRSRGHTSPPTRSQGQPPGEHDMRPPACDAGVAGSAGGWDDGPTKRWAWRTRLEALHLAFAPSGRLMLRILGPVVEVLALAVLDPAVAGAWPRHSWAICCRHDGADARYRRSPFRAAS